MKSKKFDNERMKKLLEEVRELKKDTPSIKMVSAVEKSIMQNVRGGMVDYQVPADDIYLCVYYVYEKAYSVIC